MTKKRRLILIIIIILIILIISFYYYFKNINIKTFYSILSFMCNTKVNIINPQNLRYFNDKIIIISNHYCSIDFAVINYINPYNKKIYTVSSHNVITSKYKESKIIHFLDSIRDLIQFFNLILYEIGNKNSGETVKKKMIEVINNNDIVLIFPEGTTTRNGISKEFKPGCFKLCAENKIKILPITLDYDKRIGRNVNDEFNIFAWINNMVTVTIHEPIYNDDPEILRKTTYDTIVNPLIKKYRERNIIR